MHLIIDSTATTAKKYMFFSIWFLLAAFSYLYWTLSLTVLLNECIVQWFKVLTCVPLFFSYPLKAAFALACPCPFPLYYLLFCFGIGYLSISLSLLFSWSCPFSFSFPLPNFTFAVCLILSLESLMI